MTLAVTLYTKPGCGLCDKARAELLEIAHVVLGANSLHLTEIDITDDPALEQALFDRIPVIDIGSTRLEAPIEREALLVALMQAKAEDIHAASRKVTGWRRKVVLALDRLILGFARHWAAVLTLLAGLYAGVPFLAPVAMQAGATDIANAIYALYSPVCHQFAFRSWFLFGEQTVYPRARAGLPIGSFEQYASQEPFFDGVDVTTLDADLILAAKQFKGSPRMGWKVAFCERDVAIYASIALFGLLFIVLKARGIKVPYLPFWAYVLIALVPIGLDGLSQYFANPPFNGFGLPFYPVRESTPFLRVLTGALFGIGNAWLAYPYIEDSMRETAHVAENKLIKAGVLRPKGIPTA